MDAAAWVIIVVGFVVGGGLGLYTARTVQMTEMPQLVSLFNAVGGGAAALVAIEDFLNLTGAAGAPVSTTVFVVLDVAIGAVTFTGLAHRLGQADGAHQRQADHLPGEPDPDDRPRPRDGGGHGAPDPRRRRDGDARRHGLGRAPRPDPGLGARLRRHDGPADRRGRHAGRDLAAQRLHRHGRRHGRLRPGQPGAHHLGRPRRRVGRHPDQAHGRRHEPLDPQHHDRRLRRRRGDARGGRRAARAARSARSAPTTSRSSWPTRAT